MCGYTCTNTHRILHDNAGIFFSHLRLANQPRDTDAQSPKKAKLMKRGDNVTIWALDARTPVPPLAGAQCVRDKSHSLSVQQYH